MAGDEQLTVTDSLEHERYEAELGGETAGFLTYRRVPDRTVQVQQGCRLLRSSCNDACKIDSKSCRTGSMFRRSDAE